MAARNKLTHDARTRRKIQTSQIVNRLLDHIYGKVELSQTQVRAAEILLRKTLPDLAQVDINAQVSENKQVSAQVMNITEWVKRYGHDESETTGNQTLIEHSDHDVVPDSCDSMKETA